MNYMKNEISQKLHSDKKVIRTENIGKHQKHIKVITNYFSLDKNQQDYLAQEVGKMLARDYLSGELNKAQNHELTLYKVS